MQKNYRDMKLTSNVVNTNSNSNENNNNNDAPRGIGQNANNDIVMELAMIMSQMEQINQDRAEIERIAVEIENEMNNDD